MKTKFISAAVLLILFAATCKNQKNALSVLNNPQQQEMVLDSIAGDTALLQKVNEKASAKGTINGMHNMTGMTMNSDSSMKGMMANPAMMNKMMDMMMTQCVKDTAACRKMCTKMMNNPKMMEMMRGMMNNMRKDTTNRKMNH